MAKTPINVTETLCEKDRIAILEDALQLYTLETISALSRLQSLAAVISQIPPSDLSMHQRLAICADARAIASRIAQDLAFANENADRTLARLDSSPAGHAHSASRGATR